MQLLTPEIGLIFWTILGTSVVYFWVLTLISIGKSDFIDHRTKMVWGVLVFFLPVLGMLLYYAIGRHQRINNR